MASWFVFDATTGEQRQIAADQIGQFVKGITAETMPHIHVWQEGWDNWKPVASVAELMSLRSAHAPPPPPPPRVKLGGMTAPQSKPVAEKASRAETATVHEVVAVDHIDITGEIAKGSITNAQSAKVPEKSSGADRRRSARISSRFRVVLIFDSVVFRTFSADFSLHGFRLENPVPQTLLGKTVQCYVSSPDMKSSIRFDANLIDHKHEFVRFNFADDNAQARNILKDWLDAIAKTVKSA